MPSLLAALIIGLCVVAARATAALTDSVTDGFIGPVHTAVIETARVVPAQVRWQQAFGARAQVTEWLESPAIHAQFTADPSRWQGKVVGFVGELYVRLPEALSVFTIAPFQFVVVKHLPQTPLTIPGKTALIAGRVEGLTQVSLPLLETVWLPALHGVAIEAPAPPTAWTEWAEEARVLWRTLTYTPQGQRTEAAFYDADGALRWRWRYTYNSHGHTAARASFGAQEDLRWTTYYTYTPTGNLLEKTEFTADQVLTRRWRYTYDTMGYLSEEANYDATNALLWQWRYAYDAQGRKLAESSHTANGALLWTWRYTYDAQGHLTTESRYDTAGSLLWTRRYTYDAHGNQIGEATYKTNGALESKWQYTYEAYDALGNWTKQTKAKWVATPDTASFEPVQVTYRTLTYY
jgi:YD repeat-containing protein